ncbi:peptide methionine sulfoxide reductase [Arenibacter sp. TNZ]|jgi:peptide-methionine (S)-S-oxide reductase|uniref:peptide methionine sulfoxide reductase n=1 Tax=Arenibacter TaxID=178469 RepID=UPI000CD44CE4|nr:MULTISPECIES: peptide methionine sulfoxide reductase [Arenibacter]MCM4172870.1 peptide methionine sulfoxide reductase [Arenibacter sp. TNZ]
MLIKTIKAIPLGYSNVLFENKKYAVTRSDYNKGKSIKVYAEELGGNDFISFNFYITNKMEKLNPCEMPEAKVINFVRNFLLLE